MFSEEQRVRYLRNQEGINGGKIAGNQDEIAKETKRNMKRPQRTKSKYISERTPVWSGKKYSIQIERYLQYNFSITIEDITTERNG